MGLPAAAALKLPVMQLELIRETAPALPRSVLLESMVVRRPQGRRVHLRLDEDHPLTVGIALPLGGTTRTGG